MLGIVTMLVDLFADEYANCDTIEAPFDKTPHFYQTWCGIIEHEE